MREEILINFAPEETRVALLQQGVVQELHIERVKNRGIAGNIYLGQIKRILPGMQSAFVDIGLERSAFLHIADIWQAEGENKKIEQLLNAGKTILVRVEKAPIGSKGARLSTQISIAGRTLVYLPQEKHIGISQKIASDSEREELRHRINNLLGNNETGGFIVRTLAEKATDEEFINDIAYLKKTWAKILNRVGKSSAPKLIYEELSLGQRVLRDWVNAQTHRILVDSKPEFENLRLFSKTYMPRALNLLELYQGERALFELNNVDEEIQKALARRVDLKSGGYLMIDQTEALTTIDVNTGGFVGLKNFDETVFKTNLEASVAIARQLRLRNLGGIIIVDFIDMENAAHRQTVLDSLKKSVENDHARVGVSDFSALGLVEMTRKRTRESLSHILCETCPTCGGRGEIKTAQTVAYEILREILREARQFNAPEYRIIAAPAVIDLFLEEESQALATLSEQIERLISLQAEASYAPTQYDIVLMWKLRILLGRHKLF